MLDRRNMPHCKEISHYFTVKMSAPSDSDRLILQSDWDEALREHDGKAWVTFASPGKPNKYEDLRTEAVSSGGIPYVNGTDSLHVKHVTRRTITLSYRWDNNVITRKFMAPQVRYSTVHKKKVNSLDVTDGGLAVSSDMEGHLKVWETSSGDIRRLLTGHIGDVYTCRFFPSGVVILSGGADMQLKIWSAETGQCAATLRGHKGGIQDTAIVDRGRNIVSCSRDGTAKLWDCGQSTCLVTFAECGGILNACALGATASGINLGTSPSTISDREVLTDGKMLLLACENKTLQAYGLQSREKIFELDCHSAVNSCTFISPESAVCGTEDGHVTVIDLRNYRVPLKEWKEQRSSILSLLPFKQGFFASSEEVKETGQVWRYHSPGQPVIPLGDGSCFRVTEEFKTDLELTGPDCDPVYKVVNDAQTIYTACRDGLIRKYRLDMT